MTAGGAIKDAAAGEGDDDDDAERRERQDIPHCCCLGLKNGRSRVIKNWCARLGGRMEKARDGMDGKRWRKSKALPRSKYGIFYTELHYKICKMQKAIMIIAL